MTFFEIFVSFTIDYLVKYPYVYVIENLIIASCISGLFTTITPLFSKVFGKKYGPEIYGLTGFFCGFANISGAFLTRFAIKEKNDYLKIHIVGGISAVVQLFFLIIFNENKKFEFKSDRNKSNQIQSHKLGEIV